jgi:hypothetical protein
LFLDIAYLEIVVFTFMIDMIINLDLNLKKIFKNNKDKDGEESMILLTNKNLNMNKNLNNLRLINYVKDVNKNSKILKVLVVVTYFVVNVL